MLDIETLTEARRQYEEDFAGFRKNPRFISFLGGLPEPKTQALIEFSFKGWGDVPKQRCYSVKRAGGTFGHWAGSNGYVPRYSSGSILYTNDDAGPNGEPIVKQVKWHATEGIGYIASFEEWEAVAWLIFFQLRGKITAVVGD